LLLKSKFNWIYDHWADNMRQNYFNSGTTCTGSNITVMVVWSVLTISYMDVRTVGRTLSFNYCNY